MLRCFYYVLLYLDVCDVCPEIFLNMGSVFCWVFKTRCISSTSRTRQSPPGNDKGQRWQTTNGSSLGWRWWQFHHQCCISWHGFNSKAATWPSFHMFSVCSSGLPYFLLSNSVLPIVCSRFFYIIWHPFTCFYILLHFCYLLFSLPRHHFIFMYEIAWENLSCFNMVYNALQCLRIVRLRFRW